MKEKLVSLCCVGDKKEYAALPSIPPTQKWYIHATYAYLHTEVIALPITRRRTVENLG